MSRILVTGASGFLGHHVVRLLREGGHEVVAVARSADPDLEALGVTVRQGDVLDAAFMREAAKGCELAVHAAGAVSRKPEDAETLYRVHVEGTKTVLDACREAGVRRVVHVSTSGTVAVTEDPDHVSTETDETPIGLIQRWPYYRAKLFSERAALERNVPGTFEVVCVNPTLLLGPGDRRGSSTEDVQRHLEKKLPAVVAGGLSLVDVRDAAEGVILALERGRGGERYLLSASNMTVPEFFAKLERVSGVKAPRIVMPRAPELARIGMKAAKSLAERLGARLPVDETSVDMASFFWYVDPTRAETELGWQSRDVMETLADTVRDLRDRGVVWPEAHGA